MSETVEKTPLNGVRYSVLKREAIFRVVLLLSEFWKCADHFACLVMSGE